jgi:two-component sensor histidine kinase
MPRWSLRTKLIVVAALGLAPILVLIAWRGHERRGEEVQRRMAMVDWATDVAAARQREVMDGARRLVTAVCSEGIVRRSTEPAATSSDIKRCEGLLSGLLDKFPREYSAFVIADAQGVARCSSVPSAVGVNLADREIFRKVRSSGGISVGTTISSRFTSKTIIPIAVPIKEGEGFRGMCAIGVSLGTYADIVTSARPDGSAIVSLVDASGMAIGGSSQATQALPVATRLAREIEAGMSTFVGYGQNGSRYQYRLTPLDGLSLQIVAAAPIPQGLMPIWQEWNELILAALAGAILLVLLWIGIGRWCLGPLSVLERAAAKISGGEEVNILSAPSWAREIAAVGAGIETIAAALAHREAELKSGLEQRDHMLREIHHRVKNNLQMISSLLNLQASEIRSPRLRRFFGDAQARVLTLSILHRHLYERSSWALVDFQQFISDLVRQISVGRSTDGSLLRYHIKAPIMAVGPDTAIPVGLIVTEAVGNALSHDFSGVAAPEIRITAAERVDRLVELVVEDNGRRAGPEAIGLDGRGGFGMTLVRGLAMQLGGEAVVAPITDDGLRLVVRFPLPAEQEDDA